jgi:membrane-associated PAP2 superfamily phosphatase
MQPTQLWYRQLRAPLAVFVLFAAILGSTSMDLQVAHALFYDEVHSHWRGQDNWLVNEVIHTGGRWFIRAVIAVTLAALTASFWNDKLRAVRRPLAYFALSVILCVAIVGGLKTVTNVDCPWDLRDFGGNFPFVHLFAHRPHDLRAGRCFPAAHASSGYALMALYFVFRERSRKWSRAGLVLGILAGLSFGIAQQSRGAHFLSHDLWSAMLVWVVATTLYMFGFGARLWNFIGYRSADYKNEAAVATHRLAVDGASDLQSGAGAVRGATAR